MCGCCLVATIQDQEVAKMMVRMAGTTVPQTGSDKHIMLLDSSMPKRDAEVMLKTLLLALIQHTLTDQAYTDPTNQSEISKILA